MPNVENQIAIMGPKDLPIKLVPNCCMKNINAMIIRAIKSTGIPGLIIVRPSTADNTVIEGVIIPSASIVLPPIIAKMNSHERFFLKSAKSENMPPSPRLSAFKVIRTYFTVVCNVSVQIMHERIPSVSSAVILLEELTKAFKTYNGEVPISPKTIPSEMIIRNNNYIVANTLNGTRFAGTDSNWPLRLVGQNVTGAMSLKKISSITLEPVEPVVSSVGVFRPTTRTFYLDYNGNSRWDGGVTDRAFNFGLTDDIPVAGDWDALGKTCIGVFRPSTRTFYLDSNGNGRWDGGVTDRMFNFGLTGDSPVSGIWN